MSYFRSILQNIVLSTKNTSNTPLNFNAIFTGLGEISYAFTTIQIYFDADQRATIYVDQGSQPEQLGTADVAVTVTATKLTDTRLALETNAYVGAIVTCNAKTLLVTSNDATSFTGASWTGGTPSSGLAWYTDKYETIDTYTVYANTPFAQSLTSIAPYFRVRVKNISISSTNMTKMVLMTAMTPILSVLPRKLDFTNNEEALKTSINQIHGLMNRDAIVGPMGELKTATAYRLVGAAFHGDVIDTSYWTVASPVGNGSADQTLGELTLHTNKTLATANSAQSVSSVRVGRFLSGSPNYFRSNAVFPTVTTGTVGYVNTRRLGAFDVNDGFFFEFVQTNPQTVPILSLVCRKAISDANKVTSGSFNGTQSAYWIPDTNVHTYEIWWNNKNAWFLIDGFLIHTFTGSVNTLVASLSPKIGMETINSGGATIDNTLVVRSAMINRLGEAKTSPVWRNVVGALTAVVLKRGPGHLHKVLNNDNTGTLTLYDALTTAVAPNIIATIDLTKVFGTLDFDLDFYTGLCYTNTACNATIVWE